MPDASEAEAADSVAEQQEQEQQQQAQTPQIELVDLVPDESLRSLNFETYKLTHEPPLATHRTRLPQLTFRHEPSEVQFSLQHMKLLTSLNALVIDPYTLRSPGKINIFVVLDDGNLHMFKYDATAFTIGVLEQVCMLFPPRRALSFPPSVAFVSHECAVTCDGGRVLCFYETSNDRRQWKKFHECRVVGPEAPAGTQPGCDRPPAGCDYGFTIADTRLVIQKASIEVLLQAVVERRARGAGDRISGFENVLRWITLKNVAGGLGNDWEVSRRRTLVVPGVVEIAGFDRQSDHVIVAGAKKPVLTEDTDGLPEGGEVAMEESDEAEMRPTLGAFYVWTELPDGTVRVIVRLDGTKGTVEDENSERAPVEEVAHFTRRDVDLNASAHSLRLAVKGNLLLGGSLGGRIDEAATTFIVTPGGDASHCRLQIEFRKAATDGVSANAPWPYLVESDYKGKKCTVAELEAAVQMLERFTTSAQAAAAAASASPTAVDSLGTAQMEECDMEQEERPLALFYYCGKTDRVVCKADLTGRQFLFTQPAYPPISLTRLLCLRQDVDGDVWGFEKHPAEHLYALKAFGYVQASKSKRWLSCISPEGSYAVIAEATKHAFIYWQRGDAVQGDLRNRRSGERIEEVCKQQVISIRDRPDNDDVDEAIIGVVALEDTIILLSCDTILVNKLRTR